MKSLDLVIFSGPSGVGKKTVLEELFAQTDCLFLSISVTTRKPRVGEIEGIDYCFVTKEEFQNGIKDNKFLEYAEVNGEFYGTPYNNIEIAKQKDKILLLEIDVQGGVLVKEKCTKRYVSIFLAPPAFEDLELRLLKRGTESNMQIEKRMKTARIELTYQSQYDYVVVNDKPENAAKKIFTILSKEVTYENE